ncbi:MAG TPA: carbamoyltransferase HypF, partial [Rhodocyclaceae bacterium]|nr:carbamoyltransferase HypF [Rhodocyclaceae bacterium]
MSSGPSRRIRVRGLVQGVGFRPHVWRLAQEEQLAGWVTNDGDGVDIAISGEQAALDRFIQRLSDEVPPLARIDSVEVSAGDAVQQAGFCIIESRGGAVHTAIGPDAAICPACIAEIFTPKHRRWRYAFTTCTHCGPRYTVSSGIPYDRARTSLAPFPLCPTCDSEYSNPADRRFHAETTCCPACGPRLAFCDGANGPAPDDPITATLTRLQAGDIIAIKGLGGFHLACDARNAEAVARLRQRKAREEKPFAVMALNATSIAEFAEVSPAAETLLRSTAAPIVLCPQGEQTLPGIAPGLAELGLMFPATPLHLLLWHEAASQPSGNAWLTERHPLLLVMTSANPQGEPLVIGNDEARERLAGIADAWLLHDRDIIIRCDDSVVRSAERCAVRGEERGERRTPELSGDFAPHPSPLTPHGFTFIRRARGYTPLPITLPSEGPDVLAFGGYLKNTICLTRGREAFVSQHIGSLDNAATIAFLEETVAHLQGILDVRPQLIAHDLHPDYPSTRLAQAFAAARGIPAIGVGHHHAHIAAVCAEHGITEPVLGLAIDGVGLGPDGGLWGGELLRVEGANCERLAHLAPLPLPGGDRAAREPWRMACAALHAMGRADEIPAFVAHRYPQHNGPALAEVLAKKLNC